MSRGLPLNVKLCLDKALDSALLSVETYNKPAVKFKSGGYIVTICSSLEMITFEKGSKLESISGVRDLGAFDGAINLTTVDMSECTQVKRIDEYTFYGNSNLRLFKIGTEIPPTCKDYTFYNINPYSVLKVPSGCTDAYKKATGWKKFASITGLDE